MRGPLREEAHGDPQNAKFPLFSRSKSKVKDPLPRKIKTHAPLSSLSYALSFSSSLAPLLLLLRVGRRRRRQLLQVLHLALKLAPVLQLHDAPSGAGVEPRHDAPLPVELLHLKAVQLDASADGNGRG